MRRSNARPSSLKVADVDPDSDPNQSTTTSASIDDSMKLQFRPNQPIRSTNLFSRNPRYNNSKSNLIFLALIATFIALCCYSLFTGSRASEKRRFGIVIDGGSTGTRIHVFEYLVRDGRPVFDFGEIGLVSMRVSPGLSAFAEEPEVAGGSIVELVEFARKRVPKEVWGKTEVRLMATAGLRLLKVGLQEQVLESCRRVLRVSGFKFQDDWASVISGSDEGMYAWVVANYALGTLGGSPGKTTGIIELGGASAQVTFVSSEPIPPEFSQNVKFGNQSYNLYSHSLLQFGQNVAFDLMRESIVATGQQFESIGSRKSKDPCTPRGFKYNVILEKLSPSSLIEANKNLLSLHPSGNFSECRSAILTLLQKGKDGCRYERCSIGSTFIPKLQGNFLATENFFHTSKFFGLTPKTFLSEMMVAGQKFCEEDWSKLKKKYQSLDEEDLHRFCFSSAYIVALLHDSLGIALDDERIGYANQVNNIPLDWALGAFILQITANLDAENSSWITSIICNGCSNFVVIVASVFFLAVVAYSLSKWKKPQMKTIYDLGKGKYLITRVARYS